MMLNLYFPADIDKDEFYKVEGICPVNNLLPKMMLFTNQWNGDLKKGSANFVIAKAIKEILPQICLTNLPLEPPLPKDARLGEILRYVETNFWEAILFSNVAYEFGYSGCSLYCLFEKDLKCLAFNIILLEEY